RKAAAALSSLSNKNTDEDDTKTSSKIKNIDPDALASAISRLEISSGVKGGAEPSEAEKRFNEKRRNEREAREARGRVKVDVGDVGLLVQELDLSKTKAKELLQAYEGNAVRAMRSFVTAAV
ncbi:MAG: hypothetical protein Q9218_003951, partial [Villophora microphyllina]